jgi:predicted ATPase
MCGPVFGGRAGSGPLGLVVQCALWTPNTIGYPDAWIYQTTAKGLERVDYEDTDHFQVTRNFLNRRQMFLDILLSED